TQNKNPCSPKLWTELTSLTFGKNIIFLPIRTIEKEILRLNPTLKEAKIKKKLPDKLIFELKEREEAIVLGFDGVDEFLIVDKEGVVLGKEKKSNLPLVLLKEPLKLDIGQKIKEEKVIQAINFLTHLRLNLFEPKIAKIVSPYSLEVELKDDLVTTFSFKKETQIQIDSLQFILSRAKIEGKGIKKIDLRFDKPVVTYE
ncbi:MAG: cell division protein FtsQ/DivIB, partial [Microgenomates group bacterium]